PARRYLEGEELARCPFEHGPRPLGIAGPHLAAADDGRYPPAIVDHSCPLGVADSDGNSLRIAAHCVAEYVNGLYSPMAGTKNGAPMPGRPHDVGRQAARGLSATGERLRRGYFFEPKEFGK
ncbi:MAG TPA: hypothetical protein VKE72_09800, partial [Methylocella sp.]|nr:hypothetical protein [Methylocella sp.]